MPVQDYQVGTNDLVSAMFQRRYEPNFAFVNALGCLGMVAQVRGIWPCSSVEEGGNLVDMAGQGRILTNNNAATFGLAGLASYAALNGTTQYFSRADELGLDITGGLALGGWFYFETGSLGANTQGLISKWYETGNQRAYRLYKDTSDKIVFSVSGDGTAVVSATSTATLTESAWHWCAGYFTPSTAMGVVVNKAWDRNTTSIPASIFNSSENFVVGRTNRANYLKGRFALPWIAADDNNEAILGVLYEQTRAMFGVGLVNAS